MTDVVTTDRDGIWVFPGQEGGTLGEGQFYFVGNQVEPWHLLKADLNGDGLTDIVSCNRLGGGSVAVFLNSGDGLAGGQIPLAGGNAESIVTRIEDRYLVAMDETGVGEGLLDRRR